jgi:apolipoprotein N-acyltransferase
VDPGGTVAGRLPGFTAGALEGEVEGRIGATPYVRLGNALVVGLALAILGWATLVRRRAPAKHRPDADLRAGVRPP